MLPLVLVLVLVLPLVQCRKLTVDLTIDSSESIGYTSATFACVNLDWWPPSKEDWGRRGWGNLSMLNIDLNHPGLNRAVMAFRGKVRLRLGGSLEDFVYYDVPSQHHPESETSSAETTSSVPSQQHQQQQQSYCQYPDFSEPVISTKIGYKVFSGCLRMSRWDALNEFCIRAGCTIAFGLNGLFGRKPPPPCEPITTNCKIPSPPQCCTAWTGAWDSSNAEALVRYTKQKGYPVSAWELGNELVGKKGIESHIGVDEFIADWKQFVQMMNDIYPRRENRPLLVVPDTTWMTDWFGAFLHKLNAIDQFGLQPDVVSHHLYSLGPGVNPDAWRVALNDTVMNAVHALGNQVETVVSKAAPRAEIWLGEGGGAYNSGSPNVTNAYNSAFWFVDQLGALSSTGHSSYCRQTLAGGFYGLLDSDSLRPNPDYFALLAWTQLMGREVLQVSRGQAASASTLRAYAHCMAPSAVNFMPGGVTLVFINLSNQTAAQPTLYTTERKDLLSLPRDEYIFSSACRSDDNMRSLLSCKKVLLNGLPLDQDAAEDYSIPALNPYPVKGPTPLVIKPLTWGFVTFPKAKAAACSGTAGAGVGERGKRHTRRTARGREQK